MSDHQRFTKAYAEELVAHKLLQQYFTIKISTNAHNSVLVEIRDPENEGMLVFSGWDFEPDSKWRLLNHISALKVIATRKAKEAHHD